MYCYKGVHYIPYDPFNVCRTYSDFTSLMSVIANLCLFSDQSGQRFIGLLKESAFSCINVFFFAVLSLIFTLIIIISFLCLHRVLFYFFKFLLASWLESEVTELRHFFLFFSPNIGIQCYSFSPKCNFSSFLQILICCVFIYFQFKILYNCILDFYFEPWVIWKMLLIFQILCKFPEIFPLLIYNLFLLYYITF